MLYNGGVNHSHSQHVPVLPAEVIKYLQPQSGDVMVDGTLGGGGHTRLIAERVGTSGSVLALDRDPQVIEVTSPSMADLPQVTPLHASYAHLPEVLAENDLEQLNGILLDLGLSSDQLADQERGFSFRTDGPLDLRFDPTQGEPAAKLLARLSAEHLADIIYQYGEERFSRRIARRIVERRRQSPIETAADLANIVRRAVPNARSQKIDAATRTFQALRIAVNDELGCLKAALARFPDLLAPGGRLAIISFHSLEDRLVKQAFRDNCQLHVVTRKPVQATVDEAAANPRARSAKLRVAERLPPE
ncbi:MAG: 16S rRNA (cytosine(1402)-N(4))-methyltransferase RsmH [Aeoliella sp.]